jgi:large subunit ribosomal protein L25
MDFPLVRAKDRPLCGKGFSRKIRGLGYLPAVVYGPDLAARPLVVDPKTVVAILNGPKRANTVVRLQIEGKGQPESFLAVIRDHSVHPYRRHLEHCDFMKVDADRELTLRIPIRTLGKSAGEKLGARLNVAAREITVRCMPSAVPESIEVDVTPLEVGSVLTVTQLPYPAGVKPVFDRDRVVVTVRMPKEEKKAEAAAEGEAAAPAAGEAAAPAAEGAAPAKTEAPKK